MRIFKNIIKQLNLREQCRRYRIKLWQCPQFLFMIMGGIIILTIVITNILAQKYVDPYIVSFIVMAVTVVLFVLSYILVSSFERIARVAMEKSEFIGIMSHRLRAPLSGIKWQLNFLMSDKTKPSEEQTKSSLIEMENQNEKMVWIVNNLIDLNHIEDNKLSLERENFSMKEIAESVVELQKVEAAKKDIEIKIQTEDDLPNVLADKIKIRNIIYHFVDNAILYSTKKGEIKITIEKIPNFIRCLVADEGIGISQKDYRGVFKKFFRSQESIPYQTEGTGIGLYIAREIIKRSGGDIGFSSILGKGSTFWFTLPITTK